MDAIPGIRRTSKERVDGTLVVSIEIEPNDKAAFHRLFPNMDMAVALAPLVVGVKLPEVQQETRPGQLCIMACNFCSRVEFWNWIEQETAFEGNCEEDAKQFILAVCQIESRKELDTNPAAAKLFHEHIREPFLEWQRREF